MNPTQRIRTRPMKLESLYRRPTDIHQTEPLPQLLNPIENYPQILPKRYVSTFSGRRLIPKKIKEPKEKLAKNHKYRIKKLKTGWLVRVWVKGFVRHPRRGRIEKGVRLRRFLLETEHATHELVGITISGCILCLTKGISEREKYEFEEMWGEKNHVNSKLKTMADRAREREAKIRINRVNQQKRTIRLTKRPLPYIPRLDTKTTITTPLTATLIAKPVRPDYKIPKVNNTETTSSKFSFENKLIEQARLEANNIIKIPKKRTKISRTFEEFKYTLLYSQQGWSLIYKTPNGENKTILLISKN